MINYTANCVYPILKSISLAIHYGCIRHHQVTLDPSKIRISILQINDLVQRLPLTSVKDLAPDKSQSKECFVQSVEAWGPKSLDKRVIEVFDGDYHYNIRIKVAPVPIQNSLKPDAEYVLLDPQSNTSGDKGYFYISKCIIEDGVNYFVCQNDQNDPDDIRKIRDDTPGIVLHMVSTVSLKDH